MEQTVFRKKSLERISSPEQSDTCVRIAGPGIWLSVLAVVFLLTALFLWNIVIKPELQAEEKSSVPEKVSVLDESARR